MLMKGAGAMFAIVLLAGALGSAGHAQSTGGSASEWNTPYGYQYGQQEQRYVAGTRDSRSNRVAIDGRILLGEEVSNLPRTLSGTYGAGSQQSGSGSAMAVGNQLNVITNGNWNTVIIDSTQINNGDVTAVTELNGELDLDEDQ
jgi:holdfast attachment protein HfaA